MVEVQGSCVRLYLEGLMFFALDAEQKRLRAGILNVHDGHNLKVRTFSRKYSKPGACSDEAWKESEPEFISDNALKQYEHGEIKIIGSRGGFKNIASPMVPRNREIWMPFNLIPDFEEIVGNGVTLDSSKVRPVITITGGDYFSVLTPDHVQAAKPIEKRASTRGFIPTYRLENDQLEDVKAKEIDIISIKDLITLGVATKDLGIRAYTAATLITLNKGEQLVCELRSEKGEQLELFRVKYVPDCEAKIILVNGVGRDEENSQMHSHSECDNGESMPFFHFLNYYKAVKKIDERKQFLLANEEMLVEFFKNGMEMKTESSHEPVTPYNTGGDDPGCPAVSISSGLLPN